MSLRANEPSLNICLVHDKKSIEHLTEEEEGLFNYMAVADESDYTIDGKKQYQFTKLLVDKYTPFENTLYIDVDTLFFPNKNISQLLSGLSAHDFFIGQNGAYNPLNKTRTNNNYTYWSEPGSISKYFGLKNNLPQTVSGVFYFKKCAFTEKIFSRAREVYKDRRAPVVKWANGRPDEYCYNVALSEAGYSQPNCHFVYFDKINGQMDRKKMYDNFWGIATGGNKLIDSVKNLNNELVTLYAEAFGFKPRLHVDKSKVITERRNF